MDTNELLIEVIRAQNAGNEILGHIRWILAVILGAIVVFKWSL